MWAYRLNVASGRRGITSPRRVGGTGLPWPPTLRGRGGEAPTFLKSPYIIGKVGSTGLDATRITSRRTCRRPYTHKP